MASKQQIDAALTAANQKIATLTAENTKLKDENVALKAENAALKAQHQPYVGGLTALESDQILATALVL